MNTKQTSLVKHAICVSVLTYALTPYMPVLLSYLIALNFTCFVSFGFDKQAAKKGWGRVPERTFLMLGFLGAFPALLVGRKVFRHKTIKKEFLIPMWTLFILQMLALGYILFY